MMEHQTNKMPKRLDIKQTLISSNSCYPPRPQFRRERLRRREISALVSSATSRRMEVCLLDDKHHVYKLVIGEVCSKKELKWDTGWGFQYGVGGETGSFNSVV